MDKYKVGDVVIDFLTGNLVCVISRTASTWGTAGEKGLYSVRFTSYASSPAGKRHEDDLLEIVMTFAGPMPR